VRTAGQFGEDDFHARHSRASVAKSKRAAVPSELIENAAENAAPAVANAAQAARGRRSRLHWRWIVFACFVLYLF
jgi:hypothetical protein